MAHPLRTPTASITTTKALGTSGRVLRIRRLPPHCTPLLALNTLINQQRPIIVHSIQFYESHIRRQTRHSYRNHAPAVRALLCNRAWLDLYFYKDLPTLSKHAPKHPPSQSSQPCTSPPISKRARTWHSSGAGYRSPVRLRRKHAPNFFAPRHHLEGRCVATDFLERVQDVESHRRQAVKASVSVDLRQGQSLY